MPPVFSHGLVTGAARTAQWRIAGSPYTQPLYYGLSRQLRNVRNERTNLINNRDFAIKWECNNVVNSYNFLKTNEPFLIGAYGEEVVIGSLSTLRMNIM